MLMKEKEMNISFVTLFRIFRHRHGEITEAYIHLQGAAEKRTLLLVSQYLFRR